MLRENLILSLVSRKRIRHAMQKPDAVTNWELEN